MVAHRAGGRAGSCLAGSNPWSNWRERGLPDPVLVRLDEPSTSLEPRAARGMYDAIRRDGERWWRASRQLARSGWAGHVRTNFAMGITTQGDLGNPQPVESAP